jgi:MFS family permease
MFYSLYALPNVFTLFFIGFFVDKFGVRKGLIILSIALTFFQLVFAIGGIIESYPLMLIGRIFFGVASRSLFIPQCSIISFWFKGKELSFALGIVITFP